MKNFVLLLLAAVSLFITSCAGPGYPYGRNLHHYHYGKGNGYSGKYRGARHRYNWETTRDRGQWRNYHGTR